ncbi:hypothetical protein Fmac_018055 [Flemingia macrophylla]|uniref:Gnk2-homologous domain-containing protein n=1 Tax=Flemingia macrophylla TaxID=520843 RepID=A0ABD1M3X0_9FABA
MPLNSFKLIFLCMVVSLFTTTKAQDPIGFNCENETSTNSAYVENLSTLFSFLSSNATDKTFYNDTILGRNSTDTVYGLFMCRGDIDAASNLCTNCVANATKILSSACSLSREAVIWYDNCMVRYSNLSFFSTVDTYPGLYLFNMANISDAGSFMSLLSNTMNQTAEEAANSSDRYFTKQANVSQFQTLYCLAQCTQDLSPQNCATCLTEAIGNLPNCCEGKQGGRVLFPSCNVRFELYPFYSARTVQTRMMPISPGTTELVPETKYPSTDSEDAGYISHNCSGGDNVTAGDSVFQSNLMTLLSYLSSNATVGNDFQTKEGTAYGLFTCRGDTPSRLCQQCVQNATEKVASECRFTAEAVIWFDLCWLRYSNIDFFSSVETNPRFRNLNITTDGDTGPVAYSVVNELSNKIAEMATETGYNSERYQSDSLTLNENQTVYILSQCSFDLSTNSCSGCLNDVMGSAIPWTRLGSIGGRVLYPSCILRFEFFKFYDLAPPTQPITPPTGYMSPEYAMYGYFFEKSDVYSFGVMILEIISGKKNISSYEPHHVADGLLKFVWSHWRDETPLNALDPKLKENYSEIEVIKCIQIGLLCVQENPDVRPTMVTIVSYLSSHLIELPSPNEPTFHLYHRMDPTVPYGSSSRQSTNNSTLSINEMSISRSYPR